MLVDGSIRLPCRLVFLRGRSVCNVSSASFRGGCWSPRWGNGRVLRVRRFEGAPRRVRRVRRWRAHRATQPRSLCCVHAGRRRFMRTGQRVSCGFGLPESGAVSPGNGWIVLLPRRMPDRQRLQRARLIEWSMSVWSRSVARNVCAFDLPVGRGLPWSALHQDGRFTAHVARGN